MTVPTPTAGSSLDGVSRLKGIETCLIIFSLKHYQPSLDGVSRLKGIETFSRRDIVVAEFEFGWSFPFEGN